MQRYSPGSFGYSSCRASEGMTVMDQFLTSAHELVVMCQDQATGLRAIIAVHDTTLGPSLGGLRMWRYASEDEALFDVLRLSRGMTYKSAAAGLKLGGGKAVIIGDSHSDKTPAMLRRFGGFLNDLGGKYITAEDMGIGPGDIEVIREVTPHVAGLMDQSGDPSPFTALGTFLSIGAALKRVTGSGDVAGRRVMVQGAGHVGLELIRQLRAADAQVFVHDVSEAALQAAVALGACAVPVREVYALPVDVHSPCAMGATLNSLTIPQLRCKAVVGAANNQLLDEARDGKALRDAGILYAPDFVVNAGGIINISVEKTGAYESEEALRLTRQIPHTLETIFDLCDSEDLAPHEAAMQLAEQRLAKRGRGLQAAMTLEGKSASFV